MINTVFFRLDHVGEELGEVGRVRRRANLVIDDGQLVVRLGELQHRLDEVLAIDAEDP